MSWGDEQDRLTRKARLLISSPEEVFRELRSYGQQIMADRSSYDEQLEAALIDRGEPLIELGLACYAANKDVVSGIYKRATATTDNPTETHQRKGLRLGCLSNQSVRAGQFSILFSFPESLIGAEETQRIFAEGDWDEVEALICNPSIEDELLEALYQRGEPAARLSPPKHSDVGSPAAPNINFSKLPEDRWLNLIAISRKNERLTTNKDTIHGPDMGHFHIHEAIFRMLEIAPLTPRSLGTLYHFFWDIGFQIRGGHAKIDDVLARWNAFDARSSDGSPFKGDYTALSKKDEFRCMIAAIYGGKSIRENFNSPDVAVRSAYYGKAALSVDQIREGHKRDANVFTVAALFNSHVLTVPELRLEFERAIDDYWLFQKYRQHCEQIYKERRWFDPRPLSEGKRDKNDIEPQDKLIERLLTPITKRTEDLAKQINKLSSELRWLGFVVAAALALLFIFKKWNGGG